MTGEDATVSQKVTYLNSKLGPTLVSASIGIRDRNVISQISENTDTVLTNEQKLRLNVLLEVWNAVSTSEGDDVTRAWFIGANPRLGDESVISAIREDRFDQAVAAARAMVEDTPGF